MTSLVFCGVVKSNLSGQFIAPQGLRPTSSHQKVVALAAEGFSSLPRSTSLVAYQSDRVLSRGVFLQLLSCFCIDSSVMRGVMRVSRGVFLQLLSCSRTDSTVKRGVMMAAVGMTRGGTRGGNPTGGRRVCRSGAAGCCVHSSTTDAQMEEGSTVDAVAVRQKVPSSLQLRLSEDFPILRAPPLLHLRTLVAKLRIFLISQVLGGRDLLLTASTPQARQTLYVSRLFPTAHMLKRHS